MDEQKKLKQLVARRHPEYEEMAEHWSFLEDTYEGGREWFEENIFRYLKEGDQEYEDRVKRAYRFNHTREVVDLLDKYLFKMEVKRNEKDAPASVKEFWDHATLSGSDITELAKRISNRSSVYGRCWIVVDSNTPSGLRTKAEEKEAGGRTYAYIVAPQNVLDMSYDAEGELNWVLIREIVRDDVDPMNSSGDEQEQFRLWERDQSTLFRIEMVGRKVTIVMDPPQVHGLGVVPIVASDNVISDEKYTSPALIADVAYLDRAVGNYLSNLDAIIQDQTFSQLIMPAQSLTPGEEGYDKLVEAGTKRVFTYDGEHGEPKFISPDVKQAQIILAVINKIINEIYHSIGLAGERTKEDNALGIDNSSGVAKAYDFERVNSLLASKADAVEHVENRICWLVAKWSGEEAAVEKLDEHLVLYPDNFDVRSLMDEFQIAAKLSLVEAPDSVKREQMTAVIDKLFPQLAEDVKARMLEELKSWPPKIDPLAMPGQGQANASGKDTISRSGRSALANKLVNKE
jgi:hypothetical protein